MAFSHTQSKFVLSGNGDEYIDLAHTLLSLEVSLQAPENDDYDAATVSALGICGPVNNFMHSLFNQVDVFLNQKPVSPPNYLYAYGAYIETLLNYGPAAKIPH
ncbi:hypothetical protein QAD02_007043 [Eretmocerus hayati]|uniref:Uncharacterized protein n=1 Tax=Eretmocerus hayati TaxID=131215 RepID=A0ACC2N3T1_9HYME|nr:hypothetical protein QAD02_007043 [Eretmocerus hayati]